MSELRCGSCGWTGDEGKVGAVLNLSERVDPGEIMPEGDCPQCGALVYGDHPLSLDLDDLRVERRVGKAIFSVRRTDEGLQVTVQSDRLSDGNTINVNLTPEGLIIDLVDDQGVTEGISALWDEMEE